MRTRRRRAVKQEDTFPGERAMAFYSWDWARCDCRPMREINGVPCISAAVGERWTRCLGCGECWYQRRGRREDRAAGAVA